jgi:hypothetical protein
MFFQSSELVANYGYLEECKLICKGGVSQNMSRKHCVFTADTRNISFAMANIWGFSIASCFAD